MRSMLGDILVKMGCLDDEQLTAALTSHRERGIPLGRALVMDHLCSEDELLRALAQQSKVDVVRVDATCLDPTLREVVPAKLARYYRVVPLALTKEGQEVLELAMAAPIVREALDDIRDVTGKAHVRAHLASDEAIARALLALYGTSSGDVTAAAPVVLLFGLPRAVVQSLQVQLRGRGIEGRIATALEVVQASELDVVFAPVHAVEPLMPEGSRLACNLILQGEPTEHDLEFARSVGARGFVSSALDVELLERAIRRFIPATA